MTQKSRNALDGPITTIRRGVAIYKKRSSPFWYARVWDSRTKRSVVRSTKEKGKIAARQFAEDLAIELLGGKAQIPKEYLPFYPLVERKQCAYTKVRNAVRTLVKEHREFIKKADKLGKPKTIRDGKNLRIVPITSELGDLIVFAVNTFVRPTTTELYALKHEDISIADNPRRLLVTVKKGKTGFRIASSMENAVDVYERICRRNPDAKPSDFLFFPSYTNRNTVRDIVQRQFGVVLQKAGIKNDPVAGLKYSVYSLRHTAICMRIILGGGKVDIYTLAKNAGTSVEQIERFYAKHLPISAELARNLHHFERELKKELAKDADENDSIENAEIIEEDDDIAFFRKLAEMD